MGSQWPGGQISMYGMRVKLTLYPTECLSLVHRTELLCWNSWSQTAEYGGMMMRANFTTFSAESIRWVYLSGFVCLYVCV